jgi:hypothetical protein
VLAKGGIYTSINMDDVRRRNEFIVDLFLDRTPTDKIAVFAVTGIRDIVMHDADLVEKKTDKRLSMEYDWKRRPSAVWQEGDPDHVAFATVPWETIDEFIEMRDLWEQWGIKSPRCIKTVDDFRSFAVSVLSKTSMSPDGRRYMSRKSAPDIKRLRMSLCAARRHGKAGLRRKIHGRTDAEFADILSEVGIPCKRTDVENTRLKDPFKPKSCPPTPDVLAALARLQSVIPSLELESFVAEAGGIDFTGAIGLPCPFRPQSVTCDPPAEPLLPGGSETLRRKPSLATSTL